MISRQNANRKLSRNSFSHPQIYAFQPRTYLTKASINIVQQKSGLLRKAIKLERALVQMQSRIRKNIKSISMSTEELFKEGGEYGKLLNHLYICAKFQRNLTGKNVEIDYGDLTLMNLSMQLSIAKNIIRYGSLSHLSPIFMIADVCIGLEKSITHMVKDL